MLTNLDLKGKYMAKIGYSIVAKVNDTVVNG